MSVNFNGNIGGTSGLIGTESTSSNGGVSTSYKASENATTAADSVPMEGLVNLSSLPPKEDVAISQDHPDGISTVAEHIDSDGDGTFDSLDNNPHEQ